MQLLADQPLLLQQARRQRLVDGVHEALHARVHELLGNHRVDRHARRRELQRDVRQRVAEGRAGIVRQRVGRVNQKLVGGRVGGAEEAESAAVDADLQVLRVGARLVGLILGELLEGGRGGEGDVGDGDAVEETAVVLEDLLEYVLRVMVGMGAYGAVGAAFLDDEREAGEVSGLRKGRSERRLGVIDSVSPEQVSSLRVIVILLFWQS